MFAVYPEGPGGEMFAKTREKKIAVLHRDQAMDKLSHLCETVECNYSPKLFIQRRLC